MGATLSSRIEWTSAGETGGKLDFSRSNEQLLHDMLSYVETIATEHPTEAGAVFKRPFVWNTWLQLSNFSGLSRDLYDISEDQLLSRKKDANGDPHLSVSKHAGNLEVKAATFKELQTILRCAGEKKLKEVQLCLEANQDPIAVIMGPTFASGAGVSNALLDAHERLTREKARGGDGPLADELDTSFKLLLLLNALDVKLLHNSVQKLGKEVRLTPEGVQSEFYLLKQFCGSSETACLEGLEYTSEAVFSNGCRAPPWRQVYGDICYMKAKPIDGGGFCITATTEGYYINKGFGANGELQYEREGEMATTLLSLLKSKSPHFCTAIAKQEFTYNPLPGEESAAAADNKEAEQAVSYEVEFKEVSAGGRRASVSQLSAEKKQGSSQSSRRSPEKKSRELTSSAAFKTAKSSQRKKSLGTTAEEDTDALYSTATGKPLKKSVRTSEAPFKRMDDTDGATPPHTAKSQATNKSRGASHRRRSLTTAGTMRTQDELMSDTSSEEEEEEDQTEHKPESSADLPSEFWQIQKLIKYLKAGNQTATIVALCSLLDFDLKQDTSQMAIRDVGGMDLLVNLLETNDLKCRIGALKIMTELTQNTQTRIDITNLGGVPLMIQLLKSPNRELKCLTAETIANVANVPRARRKVRQNGGLQQLVALLADPGRPGTPSTGVRSDTEVACCAARALWSCSKSRKNKVAMLKAGVVPLLARHLQAEDEALLVPVIGTIQECVSEKVYQELVRSEGMIEHLVRGLKKENRELQMHCAAAIFKCAEDPVTRDMVREYGGLEPLASLLSVREPKELLTAITGAVWKCSGSLANVKEFKKMKVVEHLIDLLNNNSGEVLVNVVGALGQCAKDADNRVTIRKGGGLPPMVQLLTGTNQALLINVTKAMEACAKEPESMTVIDRSDGVRLLWSLLKSSNPEVQASAAWAICPCIENCKDSGELVRSFVGGLELIVGLLKSTETEVLASVCAALAKIAQDEENLGVITDHGVVPLLAKLTNTQDDHLRKHLADAVARCCAWGDNRVTFGKEEAVAPLVYYLRSSDLDVHRSTAQALFQLSKDPKNCITMHEHGVVQPLLHMVGSSDAELQESAAGCISNIRHLALANEKAKYV